MKFKRHGFTMIELVLVIMIIAILAAIIVPRFLTQIPQAEIATTKANINNIRSAIAIYRAEQGEYPDPLSILTTIPDGASYLRQIPREYVSLNNSNSVDEGDDKSAAVTGTTTGGWIYDTDSGNVWVNMGDQDENDDNYSEY